MQLTLLTALMATASATALVNLNKRVDYNYNATASSGDATAKVINRCPYPVYIWSIDKQLGCPDGSGLELATGDFYQEPLRNSSDLVGGISIKISKYEQCGGKDLTQLEYFLNYNAGYEGDYLDISFVDCTSGDCPGWHDGFHFKAGNQPGASSTHVAAVNNEHCPIFSVGDSTEAAAVAYVKWDDRQTKWCPNDASMELALCGSEAPGESTPEPSEPSSSAAPSSYEKPSTSEQPSTPAEPSTTAAAAYTPQVEEVSAAEVTPAPQQPPKNVYTEVVYETVYVKNKRHAHGHRHQQFRA